VKLQVSIKPQIVLTKPSIGHNGMKS